MVKLVMRQTPTLYCFKLVYPLPTTTNTDPHHDLYYCWFCRRYCYVYCWYMYFWHSYHSTSLTLAAVATSTPWNASSPCTASRFGSAIIVNFDSPKVNFHYSGVCPDIPFNCLSLQIQPMGASVLLFKGGTAVLLNTEKPSSNYARRYFLFYRWSSSSLFAVVALFVLYLKKTQGMKPMKPLYGSSSS